MQSPISIGHKAEKGVEAIEFDLTAWVETYGSGTLTVIMRRWGDAIPYPIALEIDENNKATWTLSDIDTAKAGMAYAQLNYIVGDEVVKKSDIYTFRVMDSLTGEGEPPEAYESWLEHLTHLAAEAMAEVLDIEGIVTDKTLTVDGGIADAKAAGDALALKADKSTTYTKTEVDALIDEVEVETDTTLEVAGAAADAKKTGDELSALKADLTKDENLLYYFTDYGNSSYSELLNGYSRLSSSRILTNEIRTVGDNIVIATSNNSIKFALVQSNGSTTITAWKTGSYTSTPSEWSNGLRLWIQKTDGTNISDAEALTYIASFTISYNLETVNQKIRKKQNIAYISPTGSNANNGSENYPFATVTYALSQGFRKIMLYGGVYAQKIDLSNIKGQVEMMPCDLKSIPVFVDSLLTEIKSASVYDGNVYVASINKDLLKKYTYIFQNNVADNTTDILYADRLPQERGRQYRCTDTKIVRCSAATLEDAVTEMNGASDYRFFYDADNTNLYFTSPSSNFNDYPICFGTDVGLFENGTCEHTLIITGIECKYIRLNIDNTVNSIVSNCKVSCAYTPTCGQYTWNDAYNVTFNSCEACLSAGEYTKNDGDGFNAHSTIGDEANDPFSHRLGARLVNCWSHDNKDDGYSEHQRSESLILGGLYEYNGKGGVTPSYGCHTVCIGVISRYNWNGFVCCNGASNTEGGKGTQMECVDCVAYGNNGSNTGYGFVVFSLPTENTRNTMYCIRCSAYNNLRCGFAVGQMNTQTYDYGKLIDCKASNNGVSAYRAYGTIDILSNADVVAE